MLFTQIQQLETFRVLEEEASSGEFENIFGLLHVTGDENHCSLKGRFFIGVIICRCKGKDSAVKTLLVFSVNREFVKFLWGF